MGKQQDNINRICKSLTSIEILEYADSISLSAANDEEYSLYMKAYRIKLRYEKIMYNIEICGKYDVSEFQDGIHINTHQYGLISYYPKGDKINTSKNGWIKTSGINFILKNL